MRYFGVCLLGMDLLRQRLNELWDAVLELTR
jgi:hypothetical protein